MIKHIHARGRYMMVIGGSSGTYVNAHSGSQGVGNLRFNTTNQQMEVYDGNSWITVTGAYPQIELAPDVQAVIDWARCKMVEEERIKQLAVRHPTVADAVSAVERAEERLKIVTALVDTK